MKFNNQSTDKLIGLAQSGSLSFDAMEDVIDILLKRKSAGKIKDSQIALVDEILMPYLNTAAETTSEAAIEEGIDPETVVQEIMQAAETVAVEKPVIISSLKPKSKQGLNLEEANKLRLQKCDDIGCEINYINHKTREVDNGIIKAVIIDKRVNKVFYRIKNSFDGSLAHKEVTSTEIEFVLPA